MKPAFQPVRTHPIFRARRKHWITSLNGIAGRPRATLNVYWGSSKWLPTGLARRLWAMIAMAMSSSIQLLQMNCGNQGTKAFRISSEQGFHGAPVQVDFG